MRAPHNIKMVLAAGLSFYHFQLFANTMLSRLLAVSSFANLVDCAFNAAYVAAVDARRKRESSHPSYAVTYRPHMPQNEDQEEVKSDYQSAYSTVAPIDLVKKCQAVMARAGVTTKKQVEALARTDSSIASRCTFEVLVKIFG
jgi:hypothetical protein